MTIKWEPATTEELDRRKPAKPAKPAKPSTKKGK